MGKWRADDSLEWTYVRDAGDIIVFAHTAEEALATIKAHGFLNLNPSKLRQTGGSLKDHLKTEEIK